MEPGWTGAPLRAAPGPGQGALRRGEQDPGQLAQSDEGVADGGQGEDVRGGRRVARQPAGGGGVVRKPVAGAGSRQTALQCTSSRSPGLGTRMESRCPVSKPPQPTLGAEPTDPLTTRATP